MPPFAQLLKSTGGTLARMQAEMEANKVIPSNIEGMKALREAGVPATAFLRAGPRKDGVKSLFDPSDYNFVVHDQDRLDALTRSNKKHGGPV